MYGLLASISSQVYHAQGSEHFLIISQVLLQGLAGRAALLYGEDYSTFIDSGPASELIRSMGGLPHIDTCINTMHLLDERGLNVLLDVGFVESRSCSAVQAYKSPEQQTILDDMSGSTAVQQSVPQSDDMFEEWF